MNKYQEAFNNFKKLKYIPNAVNLTKNVDLLQKDIVIFQELVDKEKTYTKEEIIKEWKARDCIWKETEFDIQIISRIPTYLKIRIFKNTKKYQGIITLEEHQLLTKTFKMLGWEEVENVINM